jgi:hypothetical protein
MVGAYAALLGFRAKADTPLGFSRIPGVLKKISRNSRESFLLVHVCRRRGVLRLLRTFSHVSHNLPHQAPSSNELIEPARVGDLKYHLGIFCNINACLANMNARAGFSEFSATHYVHQQKRII